MHATTCANCGAALVGPYCAQCGQHAHESSRSLGALFHDAWHVVTHVDGRFWQTMCALALKPGLLTREYFQERRARYVPPVRLYLVLSVLCFALFAVGPHREVEVNSTLDQSTDPEVKALKQQIEQAVGEASKATANAPRKANGLVFDEARCENASSDIKWLEEPLRRACRRIVADHGRSLGHDFVAALPKMMFVFLPLLAFVAMLLYWFPRHHYVEYVVFFLHTHAAFFMALIAARGVSLLAHWLKWLSPVSTAVGFFVFFYTVWYVYRAMRVYFGQGRWLTLGKLAIVSVAYVTFSLATLLATFAAVVLLA